MDMQRRKPDILDALMSGEHDDEGDHGGDAADNGKDAVIAIDDGEEEGEPKPADDSPEAAIAAIRKGLDELEQMFKR